MVVFTCNNCGESLQKPKVEKHFSFSCRGPKNLTCVDCFKDFKGEEYAVHIKCVTENQRYGGKDYVEKAKKGEVKQESWMEMIKSILMHETDITAGCRNLLNNICNFNNVPRKKQKFINFIKSSTGGRTSIGDIEGVWDLIEKYKNENLNENKNEATKENKAGNGKRKLDDKNEMKLSVDDKLANEDELPKKKKKNKRKESDSIIEDVNKIENGNEKMAEEVNSKNKSKKKGKGMFIENGSDGVVINANDASKEEEENVDPVEPSSNGGTFCFVTEIQNVVTKKGSISIGKLEKKVLKKYKSLHGVDVNLDKFTKKFNKKLKKVQGILLDNGTVKLKVE